MPLKSSKKLSRRHFMAVAATFGATAATAGTGVFFNRQGSGPDFQSSAYKLWRTTQQGNMSDLDYMVLCGHLAASPHNTQPWTFTATQSGIKIEADLTRNLGLADPERRQLHQGIGCAAENVELAANYLGYATEVTVTDGDASVSAKPAVMVSLRKQPDGALPLASESAFQSIFKRTTNRGKYDMLTPVPDTLLSDLQTDLPKGTALRLTSHGSENAA